MKISIMGTRRTQITIPRFCIRLGSPSLKVNHSSPSYMTTTTTTDKKLSLAGAGPANKDGSVADGNRVMVVADSSLDAKGALQWALSHAVQSQDSIVLLHVVKPFNRKRSGKMNLKAQEVLHSMKSICQMRRPEVQVEVAMVEGEKKGQAIVEEAKRRRASLLVLGQRRRSVLWRLVHRCVGERLRRGGSVEYCIQNASCMTVAVRRKGRKLGGYLITTKRHKNFWLLA